MIDRELMQQALHTLEGWANVDDWVWPETAKEQAKRNTVDAIAALRERLAQPEQEPVAWHHPDCEGECIACLIEREVESQYGTQGLAYLRRHLYTTPQPHREWVGLTDEELSQFDVDPIEAKLMIAKLKEKNP